MTITDSTSTDPSPAPTQRVLSGITPSGPLTLGNYLGALRRFVDGQATQQGYFFVADLHAMTTPHDRRRLHDSAVTTSWCPPPTGCTPS